MRNLKILKYFKKNSEYLVEYDNGDQYLGEVNEDMEPHGRGVLKSNSEAHSETNFLRSSAKEMKNYI